MTHASAFRIVATFTLAVFASGAEAKTCSSDFDCGIGGVCLKQMYQSSGVCAKKVDDFGLPSIDLPDINSVGPKMDDSDMCSWDTDCAIGFACKKKMGQLKGYCIRR